MNNKNGFISTSLVYSFLVIFLFLMVAIIDCYGKKNTYLEALNEQVSKDIGITKTSKTALLKQMLEDNVALETKTINFGKIATTNKNGNGLFYIDGEDADENLDGFSGKIYFFRGDVDNNYVVFGEQYVRNDSDKKIVSRNKMCWRVIRTNENGGVRLIYSGIYNVSSGCPQTNTYIDSSSFNSINKDNAYVGYTYGKEVISNVSTPSDEQIDIYVNQTHYLGSDVDNVNASKIKTLLDNFYYYNTNLYESTELVYEFNGSKVLVDQYVNDAIYCNDRSVFSEKSYNEIVNEKLAYGTNNVIYGSYNQFDGNPSFKCSDVSRDRYSLSEMYGGVNANKNALSYAIALPSVADVVYAGGGYHSKNNDYYLFSGYDYWTMSPAYFQDNVAHNFKISSDGSIDEVNVSSSLKVRPVISISEDILVSRGAGLINDPYILE